jgi:anti-sigma factor ChrR (cupin superfamily)
MLSMETPEHSALMFLYVLQALPSGEIPAAEAHVSQCPECRREIDTLREVMDFFVFWPADVLRTPASLWPRLKQRIADETGEDLVSPRSQRSVQPQWEEAAPGIFVKLLAADTTKNTVSMLVRLAPETDYPPHRHSGVEELHLLDGELTIDDKKLYPGDYIRAEAGSVDHRVWSKTGCTCVLITSAGDAILT